MKIFPEGFTFIELNLRNKIVLLACGISFFTALIVGVAASWRTEGLVREFATGNVAHEARLIARNVKGAYDELENDAFFISKTPPIEGLVRSKLNGGIDPLDGSTSEQWTSRLGTIFAAIMAERPIYTQVRFIGIADGGLELVRVNRGTEGILPVPDDKLQRKATETYFQRARTLSPGQVYFSEVSYNRELGFLDAQLVPTIRAIVPVFDSNNSLYGMIVINADYNGFLRNRFDTISLKRNIAITNEAGDYIVHDAEGNNSQFYFHDDDDYSLPELFTRPGNLAQTEWTSTNSEALAYSVRVPIKRNLDDSHNVITIRVPLDELYAPARKSLLEGLALSGVLLIFVIGVTVFIASKMTKPLSKMAQTIEAATGIRGNLKLPTWQKDEVGKLANAFVNLTDTLFKSEAKARAIFDNAVDSVITIDGFGIVQDFNPTSETLFGYSKAEVVGNNINLLMPEKIAANHDGYLARYRKTGEKRIIGATRELEGKRKDGTTFPMELAVSRVEIDEEYLFTGIVRDITERRHMAVMQNEFVSTVNHELRTPLTSIRASLGILQRRIAGNLDEKSEHLLSLSLQGCERLGRLVNDILDLEKIAAGKMDFQIEECDIGELTKSIIERHHSLAELYGVSLDLDVAFSDIHCAVDPSRYSQALVNLLSNAAKFSPTGGSVKVALSLSSDDMVQICVSDNGPGIPESFRDKIFQRFAQADGSATRAKGGSGLGLNITQSIIETFNGEITFESVEGEGATFKITLPIYTPNQQAGASTCQAA